MPGHCCCQVRDHTGRAAIPQGQVEVQFRQPLGDGQIGQGAAPQPPQWGRDHQAEGVGEPLRLFPVQPKSRGSCGRHLLHVS